MHDQSKKDVLREHILAHPKNRGRDEGELHEIGKQLKGLTVEELERRRRKLNRS